MRMVILTVNKNKVIRKVGSDWEKNSLKSNESKKILFSSLFEKSFSVWMIIFLRPTLIKYSGIGKKRIRLM